MDAFNYLSNKTLNINAEIENEKENPDMLRQRRVYLTPTLILFKQNAREQTNRVLRKYINFKDYFFRLILTNDENKQFHFGKESYNQILDNYCLIMKGKFFIGDHKASVLNYSNSQLKEKSVWMLCDTKIEDL